MKVVIKKDCKLNHECLSVGSVVDLPDALAKAFVSNGIAEIKTYTPVEETKVITPEIKEDKPKRKRRAKKKAE